MKSWSFSRYETWAKCPWRAKLQYVDRIALPPDPEGEVRRLRGTRLHEAGQAWVRGELEDLDPDLKHFAGEFQALRDLYGKGAVEIEDEWAWAHRFSKPCSWKEAWVRIKLDFHVKLDPTTTLTVDLKTGKKSGNEIKHTEQGEIYAVASYLRSGGTLKEAQVEFWYADQNDSMRTTYTQERIVDAIDRWSDIGELMTSGIYRAKPNIYVCKYCPFRLKEEGGTGDCEFAVKQVKVVRKRPSSGFFDFGKN